ncbi:MAG: NifB/NifX family molybdenum-iron cluster-binding protein [Deltaproteobacteria bacterium]|nr:NifB/NifX family molybdenum-iron cluster-binding protein [Deltaproteobacteria bacterium]
MKIAISSSGANLDARVDPRFGRCRCFVIIDPATQAFEVLENEAATLGSGAGIQAAQIAVDVKQDVACMEAKNDGFLLIDLFGEKKWEAPFFQRPRLLRIGLRKGGQRPPRPVKRR